MKRMFSCSSSQVAVESWNKQDQKLLEAVEKGDVGRVSALASRKTARPAKLNAVGQSAFHLAASRGLTECLTLLLARGAPVNEKNDDGSTALHLATIACQPQCVKVLLQYGANESHVDGQNRTPLHWAASSGCASSVLLLCDHEALLDVTDAHGQTPLMLAARGNHAAICAQLLQRGADPNLADKDKKTALMLACEHCSVESAELLLSHGAALGDEDRWHFAAQTPSRALRRLLRRARRGGRAENGTGCAGNSVLQGEETPSSESEEEEEEDDEEEDEEQRDGCAVRRLRERLARKTRECQRLAATAEGIRQRVRELARLLPGCHATDGTEDEDGACLALLAQHLGELRKRMVAEEEGDGGGQTAARPQGDAEVPALAPFLAWLGDECAKMRAAKASAVARSKGLRKEVEEALRSKLHYEVVSAEAVRKSLAAWEKLAVELERALSRADETHAKMLQGSRALLENLRREPALPPPARKTLSPCPVNGTEPAPGGKSREEPLREGGSLEKEVVELKESNGRLLVELARLGGERERLQEELRGLRERDSGAEPSADGPGMATLARELEAEREEVARLRRRLAGQRRELAALRDGVGKRVREAAGDAGAGILRELHRKLDGLVRSQHEALQLVAEMEGDGTRGGGGDGILGELEGELGEEMGTAEGARVARLLEGVTGTAATPCGQEVAREVAEEVAGRWRVAAEEAKRAAEAAEARAAEREREARELRETAQGLERSLGNLRARAGELASACRDKDGKMKKLLAETEKLSAEVLGLRSQNARLQLQLEVQQKNHRDIVAIYRTHLLNAAQGFMDEGVHAMLLHILRTEE